MEKGVNAEREQELDSVDEDDPEDEGEDSDDEEDDEEDDDEDDEEDDEDDKPGRRPTPPTRRPPAPATMMDKENLKVIILEKYAAGMDAYAISEWLIEHRIANLEDGEYLDPRQISGFKSLMTRQAGDTTTPVVATPQGVPAPEEKGKVLIPRPRTKLDTFVEMLDKAVATGNPSLGQIAVDGIYKEMDKSEHGGADDKLWTLLTTMMTEGKGKSKLSELKELTEIVSNLMPQQPEGKTEAVQMAEVMERSVHDTVMEVKDTALRVSGSKNQADKMGKCPSCVKIIPMDSLYCNYCGLAFKQKIEEEGGEEEEDEGEAKERQRAEQEKQRRTDIARRTVGGKKPPQRPPPAQPTPQPAKPAAPAPKPVAPTPVQAPQPAGPSITPEERAAILHNLKRLANFIAAKDDPLLKTQALFKVGDVDDRKQGLFLAIVGRERLLAAGQRLIKEHPELADFQHYVELCDSADGRLWIDTSFEEVKRQAKLSGIMLKKEEAAEFLDKVEARLGFQID